MIMMVRWLLGSENMSQVSSESQYLLKLISWRHKILWGEIVHLQLEARRGGSNKEAVTV